MDAVVVIHILFIPIVSWMVNHRNLTCPLVLFKGKKKNIFSPLENKTKPNPQPAWTVRNSHDEFGTNISWGIKGQVLLMALSFASTLQVTPNPQDGLCSLLLN